MRGLTASDILWVWEWGRQRHAVDRALLLLSAAVPIPAAEHLDALTVGQRDRQLLTLRIATFGEAIDASADCSHCGATLEFAVRAADLLVPDQPDDAGEPVETDIHGVHVIVRPPDSRDLAEVAAAPNIEAAQQHLFRRCVKALADDGRELGPDDIPESARIAAIDLIASRDPQADITFDLRCGSCGQAGQVAFDIASFFWTEVAGEARRLLYDVHRLASAYGWSEKDILSLSPARRRMYIEVVA